ncbi:MAG: DUF4124 domain-containing protein [Gammaproteobacteria bacterium]|nr:DUF4124 domain-containing protein [Gammaproteobacteria bacterium]
MSIFIKFSFIVLLLSSYPGYATVFKCEKNGETSYSDSPCKDSEKEIASKELEPAPKKSTSSSTSPVKKTKKINVESRTSRQKRDLEGDIKALKKQIRAKKKAMELELQALEKSKSNIDYGDDEYDEFQANKLLNNINADMEATKSRYSAEIKVLQLKINYLKK